MRELETPPRTSRSCGCRIAKQLYVEARPKPAPPGEDLGEVYCVKCRACGRFGRVANTVAEATWLWDEFGWIN